MECMYNISPTPTDLDFDVYVGPSTASKFLSTIGFDYMLVNSRPKKVKWLVGGSMGALRFVAVIASMVSGKDYITVLIDHICNMTYTPTSTPKDLEQMMEQLYDKLLPDDIIDDVLSHPYFKICIFVTRMPDFLIPWGDMLKKIYLIVSAILPNHWTRYCFYSGNDPPPFCYTDIRCKITPSNFKDILRSTTCIPGMQVACNYIDGSGRGCWTDAAFSNYHLNFDLENLKGLVLSDQLRLYDTFCSISTHKRKNFSVLYPTHLFFRQLHENKNPSLSDWLNPLYYNDPPRRIRYWKHCAAFSKKIFEMISPLTFLYT